MPPIRNRIAGIAIVLAAGAAAGLFLWVVLNDKDVSHALLGPGFYEWLPHLGIEPCAAIGWLMAGALMLLGHGVGAGIWPCAPLLLLAGILLPWGDALAPYLVILSIAGCAGLYAYRAPPKRAGDAEESPPPRGMWPVVCALALVYFATFATMSLLQFAAANVSDTYTTSFERMLWFTLRGRILWTGEANFFGDHVQPVLFLLLPFYWLWPGLNVLMIVQTAALACGALAVYALAKPRLSPGLAATLAGAYLLYPAMQYLNIEGTYNTFRPISFSTPFLLWALVLLDRRRLWACALCLLGALMCKEEFGLAVFTFGLYAMLKHRRWRWGSGVAAVGLAWFVVSVTLVIPHFRGGSLRFMPHYAHLGATPGEVARTLLLHPLDTLASVQWLQMATYLLALIAPLALLPLLGWECLLMTAPAVAYAMLSNRPAQRVIQFHYHAPMVPFCIGAAVFGCERLVRWLGRWRPAAACRRAVGALVLAAALGASALLGKSPLSIAFWNPRSAQFRRLYHVGDRARRLAQAGRLIPADASLEASNFAAAHFTHREHLYRYPAPNAGAQFVLVDLNEPWMRGDAQAAAVADLQTRVAQGGHVALFNQGGTILLRRAP